MEHTITNHFACSYGAICSGCDWILKPYAEQVADKQTHLKNTLHANGISDDLLPQVHWVAVSPGATRDRVDLVFDRDRKTGRSRLGLFDRTRAGLIDLQGCPQMSKALEAWYQDFRAFDFPIQRGSIRLRVSPSGERGVWLDFANVDVKKLLDERTLLDQLRAQAVVEIGQRRKRLVERDGLLKLSDPVQENWFETYIPDPTAAHARPVPIACTIGSFTQPGFTANRVLVEEVLRLLKPLAIQRAIEFGSGSGNFTLPLASVCQRVVAYENDRLALEGLTQSLARLGWQEKVEIKAGDSQKAADTAWVDFAAADLTFVDPPRSGLKDFVSHITPEHRSKAFLYVSCYAESFAHDLKRLLACGYICTHLSIVDQFPQTRHYEIVALLQAK